MKTVDYLDAVKAAYGLTSDYQLSKKLCISSSRLGNYRAGRSFVDDNLALKLAYLLDAEPLQVLANIHAEREHRNGNAAMENFWLDVAKTGHAKYAKSAALFAA